jgi:hypothetical protein
MTTPRRLPFPVLDERAHLFSVGEAPGHEGDGGPGDQALFEYYSDRVARQADGATCADDRRLKRPHASHQTTGPIGQGTSSNRRSVQSW